MNRSRHSHVAPLSRAEYGDGGNRTHGPFPADDGSATVGAIPTVSTDSGRCDTAPNPRLSRAFRLCKRPRRCDNSDTGCRDFLSGFVQDGRSTGALLRLFGSNGGSA